MTKFKHLMIDLETMGNKPDSAIVAIGAVPFDMVSGVTAPVMAAVSMLTPCCGG